MRKVHAFLVPGLCLLAGAACAQAPAAPRIDSGDTAWMLTSTLLVILMTIPGLALFYGGLGRAKNMLSVLVQVFVIFALCSLLWAIYGYSLAFSGEGKFVGDLSKVFLKGVGLESFGALTTIPEYVFFAFQGTFAAITVALIVGSFAERIKFSAVLIFAVLWFSFSYVPMAHIVWGGGLLAADGALDFAGGTVVHINAGIAGLVGAYMVGKRIGFGREAFTPHSLTLTMVGASLLWVGWFGFNAGSAGAANAVAGLAFVNTVLATAAATLSWSAGEAVHKGKASMLGAASGAVAGLVAVTPAAGFVGPMGAIAIGLVSGLVCLWGVGGLKRMLKVDDAFDVFGVHGVGGIVGAILTGVFAAQGLGGTGGPDSRHLQHGRAAVDTGQERAVHHRLVRRGVLRGLQDRRPAGGPARERGGRAPGARYQLPRRDGVQPLTGGAAGRGGFTPRVQKNQTRARPPRAGLAVPWPPWTQPSARSSTACATALRARPPLRICGGGTKDFHGPGAPRHAGEPLDMRPLSGIVSYEPSELVVTARAGTPLAELEALLARHGQCLAFEPPRFAPGGTVGGMVAAGLSGPARASVGAVRDFVLGVEIINGRGELLRFGGQVMKNVAGYDVSRLMAGSWGQLGVITEVSLKVLPVAPAEATLRFECNQADALKQAARLGRPAPAFECQLLAGRGRRGPALCAPARRARGGRCRLSRHGRRAAGRAQRARRLAGLPRPASALVCGAPGRPGAVAPVPAADGAGAATARGRGGAAHRMAWRPALAAGAGAHHGEALRTLAPAGRVVVLLVL